MCSPILAFLLNNFIWKDAPRASSIHCSVSDHVYHHTNILCFSQFTEVIASFHQARGMRWEMKALCTLKNKVSRKVRNSECALGARKGNKGPHTRGAATNLLRRGDKKQRRSLLCLPSQATRSREEMEAQAPGGSCYGS